MMEVEGDCSLWHHLIFCEEVENDEENFIVCWRCLEPLWGGPTYKCLECNFHQHESCREDIGIDEHYFGERHHLISVEELLDKYNGGNEEVVCPGCQEPAFGPAYKCSFTKCTFFLHKSCSEQLSYVVQHIMHPEHALFLRLPSWANHCDVCRKSCNNSLFYRCFTCDFDIDIKCVSRWRISAEDCHEHSLFPMLKQIQFTCEACAEESKDIAYQCSICRVLIHSKCAPFPRTIKIRTHDDSLTRTYSLCQVEQRDNLLCRLCRKKVNTEYGVYCCCKCDYIAHMECAYKYRVRDSSATTESVASNSIGYETHLIHLVEGIDLTKDEIDGPQEINHFSHPQHNLILINEELVDVKRCEVCIQFIISIPFYGCVQCNFFIHYRCTKLPLTIKRGFFHDHSLTLLSKDVYPRKMSQCAACERVHHGFVYRCHECKYWFQAMFGVQCCLIPEILEHEGHQHSLYLVIRSSETCNGCGLKGVNFRCTHCDGFTLCFRCATLPLVAKYEYHTHLLKLSYTREDDSDEEYYCLICEKERNHPDHWFYSCVKCKFTVHARCVLEKNPYINHRRTFTDKDHKHSLTIVQKTKHSSSM